MSKSSLPSTTVLKVVTRESVLLTCQFSWKMKRVIIVLTSSVLHRQPIQVKVRLFPSMKNFGLTPNRSNGAKKELSFEATCFMDSCVRLREKFGSLDAVVSDLRLFFLNMSDVGSSG